MEKEKSHSQFLFAPLLGSGMGIKMKQINERLNLIMMKNRKNPVILEYYVHLMLVFFPLYLSQNVILFNFTNKTFLYCVLTFLSAFLYILTEKRASVRRTFRREEIVLGLAMILLAIYAAVKFFCNQMTYEKEVFLLYLITAYFLMKGIKQISRHYLNLILYSAVPLLIGALVFLLTGKDSVLGITDFLEQSEAIGSYLFMVICIGTLLCCVEKKRKMAFFYGILSICGYFVLLLLGDAMGVCLTVIWLIIMPVLFPPTVILIKKNLILCFAFAIILSNMPLLQLGENIQMNVQYNLQYSVYINLIISVAGIFICRYWDKIPKEREPEQILMIKFQLWYKQVAVFLLSVLLLCTLMGNRMMEVSGHIGVEILKSFSSALEKAIMQNESFYQQLLEDYGLVGCFSGIVLCVLFGSQIKRKWKKAGGTRRIFLAIGVAFWAQTFFYQLQPFSTPAFVIILSMALAAR